MNLNMLMLLVFILVIIVLFWIIPSKKLKVITACLKSLLQILPVSKIIEQLKKNDFL